MNTRLICGRGAPRGRERAIARMRSVPGKVKTRTYAREQVIRAEANQSQPRRITIRTDHAGGSGVGSDNSEACPSWLRPFGRRVVARLLSCSIYHWQLLLPCWFFARGRFVFPRLTGRSDFLWPYRISAIIDLGFDTCVPPVRPVYVCGNVSSVATRG